MGGGIQQSRRVGHLRGKEERMSHSTRNLVVGRPPV